MATARIDLTYIQITKSFFYPDKAFLCLEITTWDQINFEILVYLSFLFSDRAKAIPATNAVNPKATAIRCVVIQYSVLPSC